MNTPFSSSSSSWDFTASLSSNARRLPFSSADVLPRRESASTPPTISSTIVETSAVAAAAALCHRVPKARAATHQQQLRIHSSSEYTHAFSPVTKILMLHEPASI